MATIPDTDNYTVPGGVKIFFNDGTGERDLGNIVGDSLSIARDTEELEHFSNRSGTRLKDKIVTIEEAVQFDFNLDEVVIENLRYFFKGGTLTNLGAGTTPVVDQKETLTEEVFQSLENPGLTLVSVRQFVDHVRLNTTGSTFTNNDVEADTVAGTPFTGPADNVDDQMYIGKLTQYKEVNIQMGTLGDYTAEITWEYWDGSAWMPLTTGGADDLEANGVMTITVPGDWALTTVDGVQAYWIRTVIVTSAVATAALFDSIGHNGATEVLVENTDYKVDPGLATGVSANKDGRVARIAAGALVTGEEVKVDFTYTTFSSQLFDIAGVSTLEGSARVEIQPTSGRGTAVNYNFPKAQLISNGNMDLNDSEFQEIPLSLVVLDNSSVSASGPFGTVQVFT